MFRYTLLVLLAFIPLGCRSSMGTRKDASPGTEAGTADTTPDSLISSDGARLDLPAADAMPAVGVPKGFRINNHSNRTIYLQTDFPVDCQMSVFSEWETCTYFHSCLLLCPEVKQNCCVACEQNLELYAVPAGQTRAIPWDGRIFVKQAGLCSECLCDQAFPVTGGDYLASARVYTDYQCMPSGCKTTSDGIIQMATTVGPYVSTKVPFSLPFAGEEVVITITQLSFQDAGATDAPASSEIPDGHPAVDKPTTDKPADSSLADTARDLGPDVARAALSDVTGRTFKLSANEALPDAGLDGRSCSTSNPGAVYRLSFSADGTTVTIERTDGPQETPLTGTLRTTPSAGLNYDLKPTFAGGSLVVLRYGGDLIAQLAIFGSGAPVMWCIESPMRPV